MTAEILRNQPIGDYHAPSAWVSNSRLRDFVERGAAYYQARYVLGTLAKDDTAALVYGQVFETLFQRPDYFANEVAVMPAHFKDGRTTAAKEWKSGQERLGRLIISDAEYQAMLAGVDSLRTCTKGMALVNGAEQQVTLRGEIHGLRMQARPDWVCLRDFGAYSIDLKTTKNLNDMYPRGPAIYRFGYHVQAAIVRQLLAQNGYEGASTYNFAVEKQPMYRRAFIELTDRELSDGDAFLAEWCPQLAHCIETDTWPLGPDGVVTLQKPRWVKDEPPMEAQP